MSIFLFFLGVTEFVGGQGTVQPFVNHRVSLLSASMTISTKFNELHYGVFRMSTIISAVLIWGGGGKL